MIDLTSKKVTALGEIVIIALFAFLAFTAYEDRQTLSNQGCKQYYVQNFDNISKSDSLTFYNQTMIDEWKEKRMYGPDEIVNKTELDAESFKNIGE